MLPVKLDVVVYGFVFCDFVMVMLYPLVRLDVKEYKIVVAAVSLVSNDALYEVSSIVVSALVTDDNIIFIALN